MNSATPIVPGYIELAEALGLHPAAEELFAGKVRGFPVGLKIIQSEDSVLLLFQIRHCLTAEEVKQKSLSYVPVIDRLVGEKKIQIEMEDRNTWFTITNLEVCLEAAPVSQLLEWVLETFQKAGFVEDPDVCHYCRKEKVSSLTFTDSKVAQICASCFAERESKMRKETARPASELVPIVLVSPGAALVGSTLWAVCWTAYDKLFEKVSDGVILIPRLLLAMIVMVIGFAVGGPVGWMIRINRRRGRAVSAASSIFFGLAAVITGEIFYLAWLIYREVHVSSLSIAVRLMPDYYTQSGIFYLALKAMAAVIVVVLAFEIARPPKPTLKL